MWLFAFEGEGTGGGGGGAVRVFFSPHYIYLCLIHTLYLIIGGTSAKGLATLRSAITGTRLLILLLFHLGGEKPSPTRGLALPPHLPPPLPPAGLLASTSSPHEISNFLHSRRSHIVAIFFFRSSFFTAATSVIGKKKNTKKKHARRTASDPQKTYLPPPFTAFSKNGCTVSPLSCGTRRFLEKWSSQNGPSGADSSSRFWGDHQRRPARETAGG